MTPKQSPMATQTTSLSIRSPNKDTGRTCSHAPDSFARAASRRACAGASEADSRRSLYASFTRGASHEFWRKEAGAEGGGGSSYPLVQRVRATLREGQGASCNPAGRTWLVSSKEPAAEAKRQTVQAEMHSKPPTHQTTPAEQLGPMLDRWHQGGCWQCLLAEISVGRQTSAILGDRKQGAVCNV